MAHTSNQVTQNGNTTQNWTYQTSAISHHQAIVLKPETGSSQMELERIRASINPTRYVLTVRVIGAGAMAFRVASEQMD